MSVRDASLSVLVCRGCCCGTQDRPDHAAHLEDRTHGAWIDAIVDFIESNRATARPRG